MEWKSGRTISIFLPVELLLIYTIVLRPSHTGVCCRIGRTSSSLLSRSIPGFRDWSRYVTLGGGFHILYLQDDLGDYALCRSVPTLIFRVSGFGTGASLKPQSSSD